MWKSAPTAWSSMCNIIIIHLSWWNDTELHCCPRCLPNNNPVFMFIDYSKSHCVLNHTSRSDTLLRNWMWHEAQIFTEKCWNRFALIVAQFSQTWLNKYIWDNYTLCIFFLWNWQLHHSPFSFCLLKRPLFLFLLFFL